MSEESFHQEVLLAGFGGQGVVLAGRLLATAGLEEGREIVWAPSYGPEMRGGAVHCTVIIASGRIGSPEVSLADALVIMDSTSLGRFSDRLKPGGLLVLNSSLVTSPESLDERCLLPIPANDAAEDLGEPRVANVVMLGAFLRANPVVRPETVLEAMRVLTRKTRAHLIEVNRRALERGAELAEEAGLAAT